MFERLALSDAAWRAERLRNGAAGLASSLRLCGAGTQEPLWDLLPRLRCPVLAMAGSDDTRFATHALRITRLAPQAVATLVPGGGHAVHLAQPEQAGRIVRHWLDAVSGEHGPTLIGRTSGDALRRRPQRSNPTVRSAPVTIWRRAVVPNMGSSAPPSWSPSASRTGAMASGVASNARSDHTR